MKVQLTLVADVLVANAGLPRTQLRDILVRVGEIQIEEDFQRKQHIAETQMRNRVDRRLDALIPDTSTSKTVAKVPETAPMTVWDVK